jgi:hypothetical protein
LSNRQAFDTASHQKHHASRVSLPHDIRYLANGIFLPGIAKSESRGTKVLIHLALIYHSPLLEIAYHRRCFGRGVHIEFSRDGIVARRDEEKGILWSLIADNKLYVHEIQIVRDRLKSRILRDVSHRALVAVGRVFMMMVTLGASHRLKFPPA